MTATPSYGFHACKLYGFRGQAHGSSGPLPYFKSISASASISASLKDRETRRLETWYRRVVSTLLPDWGLVRIDRLMGPPPKTKRPYSMCRSEGVGKTSQIDSCVNFLFINNSLTTLIAADGNDGNDGNDGSERSKLHRLNCNVLMKSHRAPVFI